MSENLSEVVVKVFIVSIFVMAGSVFLLLYESNYTSVNLLEKLLNADQEVNTDANEMSLNKYIAGEELLSKLIIGVDIDIEVDGVQYKRNSNVNTINLKRLNISLEERYSIAYKFDSDNNIKKIVYKKIK